MQLIESKTLGSAQASIEFTNIPNTYTDLYLVYSLRDTSTNADGGAQVDFRFNSSSAAEYSFRRLLGDGSSASSYAESSQDALRGYNFIAGANATANTFSNGGLYITNYLSSTTKSMSIDSVYENNGTTARQILYAATWANNNAITAISLYTVGANLVQGSTATLYGITKGSDGTTTVS